MISKKDKYILVSFKGVTKVVLNTICPDFLKGGEVVDLSGWNQNSLGDLKSGRFDDLFLKLNESPKFDFPEVNKDKYVPLPKKVSFECDADNSAVHEKADAVLSDSMAATQDDNFTDSSSFFDYRLGKAYPGVRGIKIIDDSEAATSFLQRLLTQPLAIKSSDDPIWYFRGNSSYYFDSFEILDSDMCLIDSSEYRIKRVAIYHGYEYWRDFVYVESEPEEPCGLFDYLGGTDFQTRAKELGLYYCYEEYAVFIDKAGKKTADT